MKNTFQRVWNQFQLGWGIIALIYALGLVSVTLALHNNDFMYFVNLSPAALAGDPNVPQGYDGQFSYLLALNPFQGIPLVEERAYRAQRIAYPLIAHLMALGRADWAPVTLVVTNILALALGTMAFAVLLKRENAPPWIPIVFFAWIGLAQTLLYDLNELTAIAFALWGCYFFLEKKYLLAGVLFGIGALGKEFALLLSIPAMLTLALEQKWRNVIPFSLAAFLPYLLWMLGVRALFGAWSFDFRATQFELIPFGGLYNAGESIPFVLFLLALPAVVALFLARRAWKNLYTLCLLASFLFLVFLPHHSYQTAAVYRVNSVIVLAAALTLAHIGEKRFLNLFGALWTTTALIAWLLVIQA